MTDLRSQITALIDTAQTEGDTVVADEINRALANIETCTRSEEINAISERIENPPNHVPWWDYSFESPTLAPMPGSLLPCGCHVREPDYETVLCAAHLAELNSESPTDAD